MEREPTPTWTACGTEGSRETCEQERETSSARQEPIGGNIAATVTGCCGGIGDYACISCCCCCCNRPLESRSECTNHSHSLSEGEPFERRFHSWQRDGFADPC